MNLIKKTVEFITAIEAGNWYDVEEELEEDFTFYGPMPDPFDKETWLAFQKAIRNAFPDWSLHLSDIEQGGNKITITIHITGTHTKPLILPLHPKRTILPTYAKINLPVEQAILVYRGEKIESIRTQSHLHGGILGILEQLGIE